MLSRLSSLEPVRDRLALENNTILCSVFSDKAHSCRPGTWYILLDDAHSLMVDCIQPNTSFVRRWGPLMAVSPRVLAVHLLSRDYTPTLQELAFLNHCRALQISSSFRSLREVHAYLRCPAAFWAIDQSVLVPTLRVLSLSLDWIDTPSLLNVALVGAASHLLSRLGSLPLLEDLRLVINGPTGSPDEWNIWSASHPSSFSQLSQLSQLRRLTVSIDILPRIWMAASQLPLLESLVAVEKARPGRNSFASPPDIYPFTRGGFRSLESLELYCSWARAQHLFPESMDDAYIPLLRTFVLKLPATEPATGRDFRKLLRRMRPVQNQIHHLIFDGSDQWHFSRQYDSIAPADLDDLVGFTALRYLCLSNMSTEVQDPAIQLLVEDHTHPNMEVCTVLRPVRGADGGEIAHAAPLIHTLFLDALSCSIIQHSFPSAMVNHRHPVRCVIKDGEANCHDGRFVSPTVIQISDIPRTTWRVLVDRFPSRFYTVAFEGMSSCQFGRHVWFQESDAGCVKTVE